MFFLACCRAGLAGIASSPGSGLSAKEGPDHAENAVAALRQAVAMGYRNPDTYRTESALDPLRARPYFQALILDPVMRTDPFVPARSQTKHSASPERRIP
jgi:hypothetical protein